MFLNVCIDLLNQKSLVLIENAGSGPHGGHTDSKPKSWEEGICIFNKLTCLVSSPGWFLDTLKCESSPQRQQSLQLLWTTALSFSRSGDCQKKPKTFCNFQSLIEQTRTDCVVLNTDSLVFTGGEKDTY